MTSNGSRRMLPPAHRATSGPRGQPRSSVGTRTCVTCSGTTTLILRLTTFQTKSFRLRQRVIHRSPRQICVFRRAMLRKDKSSRTLRLMRICAFPRVRPRKDKSCRVRPLRTRTPGASIGPAVCMMNMTSTLSLPLRALSPAPHRSFRGTRRSTRGSVATPPRLRTRRRPRSVSRP